MLKNVFPNFVKRLENCLAHLGERLSNIIFAIWRIKTFKRTFFALFPHSCSLLRQILICQVSLPYPVLCEIMRKVRQEIRLSLFFISLYKPFFKFSPRFIKDYFNNTHRGYGANIGDVFYKLNNQNLQDIWRPAEEQFDGTGSYGNGGAMRVSPVALFAHKHYENMIDIAQNVTKLTHTHPLGVNGALLQVSIRFESTTPFLGDGIRKIVVLSEDTFLNLLTKGKFLWCVQCLLGAEWWKFQNKISIFQWFLKVGTCNITP